MASVADVRLKAKASTAAATVASMVFLLAAGCAGSGDQAAVRADPRLGSASIEDDTGDATRNGTIGDARTEPGRTRAPSGGTTVDLRRVTLDLDPETLTVTYELADGLPEVNTVILLVRVFSEDGNDGRDLGVKWVDGDPPLVFVIDVDNDRVVLDGIRPEVDGSAITVRYPASVAAELGESVTWSARSFLDGEEVDRAPQSGSSVFPG